MDSILSILARSSEAPTVERPRARDYSRVRIRPTDEVGDATTLLEISRLLRALRVPAKLEHFRRAEPPVHDDGDVAGDQPHPDAGAVLRACRDQHPEWERVSASGFWIAYCTVLRERCDVEIERFLLNEPTQACVLAAIDELRPREADDHPLLVWTKLAWHHPENPNYDYSRQQIHWAWIEVIAARRRLDAMGSVLGLRKATRVRARALRKLATELGVSKIVLLDLLLAAYDSEAGTLDVKGPGYKGTAPKLALSPRCRNALDDWIEVRGPGEGTLFCEAPADVDQHRVPLSSEEVKASVVARGDPPWRPLNNRLIVEALCRRRDPSYDPTEGRYIHGRLRGFGDWSEELLGELEPRNQDGTMDVPPLTKDQEKRVRQKLRPRMDEILERE